MEYGYVRVSSKTQNEARQIDEMQRCGLKTEAIFVDKQSGKDFARSGYRMLVKKMQEGDTLFVKSIDRFGRNYKEILEQWSFLTKTKKVDIVVLDMPLLDTRKNEELMELFIGDIVLQILSYAAETQRTNIRQSQEEGIRAAKARGVVFGRPRAIEKEDFLRLYKKVEAGEWSKKDFCRKSGISRSTYERYLEEYLENG